MSSLAASAVDFLTAVALFSIFRDGTIISTVGGAVAGAIANFIISRIWVFGSTQHTGPQIIRYALVWMGSLLLNVLGTILLHDVLKMKYAWAKILVAILVGTCYNYWLQKKFVFR